LAQPKPGATADGVKALVYDVFGTCVDWRNGVAREAERILKPLGYFAAKSMEDLASQLGV